MARAGSRIRAADREQALEPPVEGPSGIQGPSFTRKNYVLLGVALAVIALGYVLLGQGSTSMAPVLLVIGYLVLVPLGILKR